ncbi:MAG: DUF4443 domain-containing protein [Nitrososphaeria archaeon]|nr:DUF4443 domain-containing protein [Nitrososphaeria archaeon]
MSLIDELKSFTTKKYVGPQEYFDYTHVALLIYCLGEYAPKSRLELSHFLGLGEGSVRTILKRLKANSIINVTKKGVYLSEKGLTFYKEFKKMFPLIIEDNIYSLAPGKYNVIVLAKKLKYKVFQGIEQRDQAIKYGATGAITLVYEKESFKFPNTRENVEQLYPNKFWNKIKSLGKPEDGDVLIICFAEDRQKAYIGCFAAALSLFS